MKNEFIINTLIMSSAVFLYFLMTLVFLERYVRDTKYYTKFILFKSWSTKIVVAVILAIYFFLLFTS